MIKMTCFLFCISFNLFAQESLLNRVYRFTGQNSSKGAYFGELEIREKGNKVDVTRIMTYESFKFENLAVQEVWTGEAAFDLTENKLVIKYLLKKADFLFSVEDQHRSVEDFKNKTIVEQTINFNSSSLTSQYFRNGEVFKEEFIADRLIADKPLWENKRYKQESLGKENSAIFHLGYQLMSLKVMGKLHAQPLAQKFKDHPDYKNKKQYYVYDPTDFSFYQQNKDVIRLVNKSPDVISLVEDIQRRNAYVYKLEEKMQHFEERMHFHLNEFGLFSSAVFDNSGKFLQHEMDGDGALWTGMYLASQGMRYKVTRDNEALENMKKSLRGLMLLMDITGDEKNFARNVEIFNEKKELNKRLIRGSGIHSDKIWLAIGNNDMYKGIVHGFIWAYLTLPESEKELRKDLLLHMQRVPELEVAKKIQNKASAWGLRALASGSEYDREQFVKSFKKENRLEKVFNIEGNMHFEGIVDWSGVNLGMVGGISDLLIAKALNEKKLLQVAQKELALQWKDMANTKRDFITIAAYAFAVNDGFDIAEANELNDGFSKQQLRNAWNDNLGNSLWSLREIPIHRSLYNATYDYSLKEDWCLSWWPRLPWKSFKRTREPEYHYQSVESYPLFEGPGMGSNFIWKDQAFGYKGSSNKFIKSAGADYLYTYWMARFSNLISERD